VAALAPVRRRRRRRRRFSVDKFHPDRTHTRAKLIALTLQQGGGGNSL